MAGVPSMSLGREVKAHGAEAIGFDRGGIDEYGQEYDGGPISNAVFGAIETWPGITQMMGTTAYRGSRTIVEGSVGGTNSFWGNFKAGRKGRFASTDIFKHVDNPVSIFDTIPFFKKDEDRISFGEYRRRASTEYSPFNFADFANSRSASISKRVQAAINMTPDELSDAGRFGKWKHGFANKLVDSGMIDPNNPGTVWQRGTASHIMASGRISRLKEIDSKTAHRLNRTARSSTGTGRLGVNRVKAGMHPHEAASKYAAGSSAKTGVSSYIRGFTTEVQDHKNALDAAKKGVGGEAFEKGREKAASWMKDAGFKRGEKIGLKEAARGAKRSVGKAAAREAAEKGFKYAGKGVIRNQAGKLAVRSMAKAAAAGTARAGAAMAASSWSGPGAIAVGAVMTLWTAYDIAKSGATIINEAIVKPAVSFAKDARKSYVGQIKKAPMGMGFVDNTVANTSRQRGVMAISNSRLNARSVLGNEAANIHAHFGGPR